MYKDLYGGDNCNTVLKQKLTEFYRKDPGYQKRHGTMLRQLASMSENESQLLNHLKEPHLNLGERYTNICNTPNYESWVTFFKNYVNTQLTQRKRRSPL